MERLFNLAEHKFQYSAVLGESERYPEAFYEECDKRGDTYLAGFLSLLFGIPENRSFWGNSTAEGRAR